MACAHAVLTCVVAHNSCPQVEQKWSFKLWTVTATTQNLVVKFDGEICGGVLVENAFADFPSKRSSKISCQTSPNVRHQFRRKLRRLHSGINGLSSYGQQPPPPLREMRPDGFPAATTSTDISKIRVGLLLTLADEGHLLSSREAIAVRWKRETEWVSEIQMHLWLCNYVQRSLAPLKRSL